MTDEELLETIISCAKELGWNVAVPSGEDEGDNILGLILGTPEYLDLITASLESIQLPDSQVTH